jgi:hypothetical protein
MDSRMSQKETERASSSTSSSLRFLARALALNVLRVSATKLIRTGGEEERVQGGQQLPNAISKPENEKGKLTP